MGVGSLSGRRAILLLSMGIFLLGLALTARSTSMPFLIGASTFMSIGHFPIVPLCFTAIGDFFPPAERAKWTGMLNLPTGIAAAVGPVLGGFVSESAFGWRGLYWGTIPLLLIAGGLAVAEMPGATQKVESKIDIWGTVVRLTSTTTLIIGVSRLGTPGTINTLVAQFAVPKRLLGLAVGAIFFLQMIGLAVAPAILGLIQNSTPDTAGGLKLVFLVGAVAMAIALLMIITIPQLSLEAEASE